MNTKMQLFLTILTCHYWFPPYGTIAQGIFCAVKAQTSSTAKTANVILFFIASAMKYNMPERLCFKLFLPISNCQIQ